jgi:hypothetical protein
MMISGHKTRSVFDRYNIVSLRDLEEAAAKQEIYINMQASGTARAQFGHNWLNRTKKAANSTELTA